MAGFEENYAGLRAFVHNEWEDETVRESTGQPPSYAEVKKSRLHFIPMAALGLA